VRKIFIGLCAIALLTGATIIRVPYPPTLAWITSFVGSFDSNGSGNADMSLRQAIPATSITVSGTHVRVTFRASTVEGLKVDNASIVERDGTTANGTATPTELKFSGVSGFSCAADSTVVSDDLNFTIDETKSYLVIIDISSDTALDSQRYKASFSGARNYYKTATNSYNTQTVSGFSDNGEALHYVDKIEVR
jgi:hypothetical protein